VNPGDLLTLTIEKVAHGGFCVARFEGVVIFVRHALPGEVVEAQLLALAPGKKSWFAQTINVLTSSPQRVKSKCEFFKADGCGGCDWQHTTAKYQQELKLEVLIEQLTRFGQIENAAEICTMHAVEPSQDYWRSRIRLVAAENGAWGFRKFRSHEIQEIDKCLIADEKINQVLSTLEPGIENDEVLIVNSKDETIVYPVEDRQRNTPAAIQEVDGHDFSVTGDGFWQVHPAAALTLSNAIKNEIKDATINSFADLYAGVGVLAHAVLQIHPNAKATVVESDRNASNKAIDNLAAFKTVKVFSDRVDRWVSKVKFDFDLVVLDPPRSGAGQNVMRKICEITNQKIIYVACDPAALARDVLIAKNLGWKLTRVAGFDLFPMTHHLESVAVLVRD